jgi:hypothetical protein
MMKVLENLGKSPLMLRLLKLIPPTPLQETVDLYRLVTFRAGCPAADLIAVPANALSFILETVEPRWF